MDETLDCLIIGGGPAGLTAAIYLSRFHLDILVVDGGRAAQPGFPAPITMPAFPTGSTAPSCLRG